MKKVTLAIVLIFALSSCVKYLTPFQAAQGSQKCGRAGVR